MINIRKIEFFIAKKHILERKRQSIIAILGGAIGVLVLTVSIAISNGLDKSMINNILSIGSHIVVSEKNRNISNYRKMQAEIEVIKGVKGAVPQVATQGLLKYSGILGSYISGVKINGIDFKDAKKSMDLNKKIVEGTMELKKPTDFLIGKALFDQLSANLGDIVTIVSGDNKEMRLTIAGVFQTGYQQYDTSMIIVPLKVAQLMSYNGDTVSNIEVFLNNPYNATKIRDQIDQKLGTTSKTWGELNKSLLSALTLEKTVMIILFSLIVIIAGFVVWVILNMLVKEKTRDIGIMRSMGFSSKNIRHIFMIEGLILGVLGIIIGLILSGIVLWYIKNHSLTEITSIYYINKIPVDINTKEVLTIVGANIVIIFFSSVFPAYRAAKLQVVEALKYE